jgi:hypothetical protein
LLYDLLWKSKGDLAGRSLKGEHHREFIKMVANLRQGKWPGPTSSNSSAHIEISYKGQNRLMVAMDYSGELISKAFVREDDSEEVRELLDHLDHAAGVMLFVDPADVVDQKVDIESTIENDFGIVQAISRLKSWPGGHAVPIVLVYTKVDMSRNLVGDCGGAKAFTEKFFPRLITTVKHLKVAKISSVQTRQNGLGEIKKDFVPTGLDVPLRYCLDMIHECESVTYEAKKRKEYMQVTEKANSRKLLKDRIINWAVIAVIVSAIGIVVYYGLVIIWPGIVEKLIFGD